MMRLLFLLLTLIAVQACHRPDADAEAPVADVAPTKGDFNDTADVFGPMPLLSRGQPLVVSSGDGALLSDGKYFGWLDWRGRAPAWASFKKSPAGGMLAWG